MPQKKETYYLRKSRRRDKKLMLVTPEKIIHFGGKGYSDYTIHKNPARKQMYLTRHRIRENWKEPLTPGALSRWILWNKPSLESSVRDYEKRFNLKVKIEI